MKTVEQIRQLRLAILIKEYGTQAALAKALEKSSSQLSQWKNASPDSKSGKPRSMDNQSARDIEKKINKPRGWMDQPPDQDSGIPQNMTVAIKSVPALNSRSEDYSSTLAALPKSNGNEDSGAELEPAPPLRSFREVPVVGTVQGGMDGFLEEYGYPVGHGDGVVDHPTRDRNAYALRVRGDSMRPRIRSGEFIVVEPSGELIPGSDVVVTLKDGRKMVKELLYIREHEIALVSVNGDQRTTIPSAEVETIHCVGGVIPAHRFRSK